ncbi:hypothetical protein SADUNF_Sadunf01G0142400 [Salix dunnii]|uniref:Pentatricopeptide repeat-containing protein n=1 Tax=Salix dunnii TaxID=1413687 RepID=A0A835NC41_9ROSI|nr:hypothetical protein SADUNF_Sadunf01G0142400 [Salix dunnii]
MKFHELAERSGFILYAVVANSLIDMYSKRKRIDMALEVFHQIPDKDVVSWTSVISGLRINNGFFEALLFFRQMKLKLKPNSNRSFDVRKRDSCTCIKNWSGFGWISTQHNFGLVCQCGRMGTTLNQFNSNEKDVRAWNILLTRYAQQGKGAMVVELLHRIRFVMVTEGLEYFQSMKLNYGVSPNLKHHACVADLLGHGRN